MVIRRLIIVAVLCVLTGGYVTATEPIDVNNQVSSYYSDIKRGWWWYEKIPEKRKEEPQEKEKIEQPIRKLPSLSDYTMDELWNMHPDDFQALLMEFMKKAVQFPTVENVTEYLTMQDIARRKSLAFANVASYVTSITPQFDVGKDSPIAVPGIATYKSMEINEIERKIKENRNDFALLYFYSPTCPYCETQSKINKHFITKYGWGIKGIDVTTERKIASQFGIETTPTMLLIYRYSQDYQPVSMGVVSFSELETRVYRGIRILKGEITPEEYSLYDFQKGSTFDIKRR